MEKGYLGRPKPPGAQKRLPRGPWDQQLGILIPRIRDEVGVA